ncbi:hypothetical protein JN535_04255 [Cellulosimicrobium cellulans]|uniref:minor capsid protein n=1 Tax=Cellulosimicrobium cellulans TaxID=1710 RepID=UPI00196620B7|nr:minor capsid protein [Cellulosimicrobium cellulans]MBN0039387.1 hypothetical protein [Cellulosimicrobium cellulans]
MDDAALTKVLLWILAARCGWAWIPDGINPSAAVRLFYGVIGTTPDEAVGVTVYGGSDELENGLTARRVQLWHRGPTNAPDGADALAGASFAALQGLSRVGGINTAFRLNFAHLGADANGRQERSDNYQIIIDNPEASHA